MSGGQRGTGAAASSLPPSSASEGPIAEASSSGPASIDASASPADGCDSFSPHEATSAASATSATSAREAQEILTISPDMLPCAPLIERRKVPSAPADQPRTPRAAQDPARSRHAAEG